MSQAKLPVERTLPQRVWDFIAEDKSGRGQEWGLIVAKFGEIEGEAVVNALLDAGLIYEPVLGLLKVCEGVTVPADLVAAFSIAVPKLSDLTAEDKAARRLPGISVVAPIATWPEPGADWGIVRDVRTHGLIPARFQAKREPDDEPIPEAVRVSFVGTVRGFIGRNGLRFVCPECDRFVERSECRAHGKVKGRMVLKVKCSVDLRDVLLDGNRVFRPSRDSDADRAVLVLWGEVAGEKAASNAFGLTEFPFLRDHATYLAAAAEAFAREAMTPDVVGEAMERALIGASIAGEAWLVPVRDEQSEAKGWALVCGVP